MSVATKEIKIGTSEAFLSWKQKSKRPSKETNFYGVLIFSCMFCPPVPGKIFFEFARTSLCSDLLLSAQCYRRSAFLPQAEHRNKENYRVSLQNTRPS